MVKKIFAKGYVYLVLAFMYAPILLLAVYSFTTSNTIGVWSGFSFDLYGALFSNAPIMTAVKNTLLIAFTSSVVATILGTMGAIGIYYSKSRTKKIVNAMSQISVVNAEIVTAISLMLLFVLLFGLFDSGSFGFVTLLIGHVVLSAPFVVLSVIPKLKQMDSSIYEAALDLGATPVRALFQVVLPEILSGIFAGFMLAVTLSLDDYIITVFTRNSSFQTISTYVYDQTKKPLPPELRALSTIIFILILVITILLNVRASRMKKQKQNQREK